MTPTPKEAMENDMALILLSIDVSKQRQEPHRFLEWPVPGDMMGASLIATDVKEAWAKNIKDIYLSKARPIVFLLLQSGYKPKESSDS